MKNRKILVVYNICGIVRENIDWYIECINSVLNQDFDDYHVVVSSCMNSTACMKKLYETFRDKISYCFYPEKNTIQVTFNKTVREMVEKRGEYEGYLYIDSGVNFEGQKGVLPEIYKRLETGKYAIITVQTDTDTSFNDLLGGYIGDEIIESTSQSYSEWSKKRGGFRYETEFGDIQITEKDFVVPPGGGCNLHVSLFSNEYWKTFDRRISPDVFVAFCAESTYIWSAKALKKDWVIVKDIQVRHVKHVEQASGGYLDQLIGPKGKYWDNLFCGRSSKEWMSDSEAKRAGLGYHNHPNAPLESRMQYDLDAYNEDETAKYPEDLKKILKRYFFLTKEEFDYDEIKFKLF